MPPRLIMVIILQHIPTSNHDAAHSKLTQCYTPTSSQLKKEQHLVLPDPNLRKLVLL